MMFRRILIISTCFIWACSSPETPPQSLNHLDVKRAAEENKRNFNPGFVTEFHSARVFKISDYQIQDSLLRLERMTVPVMRTVAGELPENNSKGEFRVAFFSEKGEKLYEYGIPSPLYVRQEHGAHRGLYRIKDGSFLIPMPPIKEAVKIVLKDSDGTEYESTYRIQ